MRAVSLGSFARGINRLRTKGGAAPDGLYDLVNGYVTQAGTVRGRPGTVAMYSLPAGTKGLCMFQSKLHVFANTVIASSDPMVIIDVLRHPDAALATLAIARIHFAAPFLGYLYVVAEFANGDVFHYWLQSATTWQASTVHMPGDVVQPSVANGLAYRAERLGDRGTLWQANAARALGDVVEPTTDNGYQYTVIDLLGAAAKSGPVEPSWNIGTGAVTYEDVDLGNATPPSGGSTTTTAPPDVIDRYGSGTSSATGGAP